MSKRRGRWRSVLYGVDLQEKDSNSPELLWSRAGVLSVREKASCLEQRDERKKTTAKASKTKSGDIETGS